MLAYLLSEKWSISIIKPVVYEKLIAKTVVAEEDMCRLGELMRETTELMHVV